VTNWHITNHIHHIHGYADDTQLYLHGRRDNMTSTARRLENCITDVGQWMSAKPTKVEHREDRATLGWIKTRSVLCD